MRVSTQKLVQDEHESRWRVLACVCGGLVLSMTTWFSATAITPSLIGVFGLTLGGAAWLTNMVQFGFVVGALTSSLFSLPDLVAPRRLMGIAGLLAAVANLSLLWVPNASLLFLARFMTGVALAGIYPPSLKLISTWFVHGRGLALGSVIAALTLGSAFPNLIRALTHGLVWQDVVISASISTFAGAVVLYVLAREGPFPFSKAVFDPFQVGAVLRNRALALANLGYFGHMWELYAMWGWFLSFVTAALPGFGLENIRIGSLITFVVIASGAVGAIVGGVMADRIGRPATAIVMLVTSGSCCILIGFAFCGPAWLFIAISILWGMSVIGDSAQFSAIATEISDSRYVGTALALQLGIGFALTIGSIRLTPMLASAIGWRWSFLMLAPGPVIGIIAMLVLRRYQLAGHSNSGPTLR